MQWVVAPLIVFLFMVYRRQQEHHTDIAVLKAETSAAKVAHDREFKELRDSIRGIFDKLNSIEEALRK